LIKYFLAGLELQLGTIFSDDNSWNWYGNSVKLTSADEKDCGRLGKVLGANKLFTNGYELKLDLTKKKISNHMAKFDISFDILLYGTSYNDLIKVSIGPYTYYIIHVGEQVEPLNGFCSLNEYLTEIELSFEGYNLFSDSLSDYQIKFEPIFQQPSGDKYFGIRALNIFQPSSNWKCQSYIGEGLRDNRCLSCSSGLTLTLYGNCDCPSRNAQVIDESCTGSICEAFPEDCAEYDGPTSTCRRCLPNYVWSNNSPILKCIKPNSDPAGNK
jgi:hypothetical protein